MFEIKTGTLCKLHSVTIRREKHGEESKPAVTIHLSMRTANRTLDDLSRGLSAALYQAEKDGPAQGALDGVEAPPLTKLRSEAIEQVNVKGCFEGWTLGIEWGITTEPAMKFGGCKVDKFRVTAQEGGTAELRFRVGTSDVDAKTLGRLGVLIDSELTVTLIAPEVREEQTKLEGTEGKPDVVRSENGPPRRRPGRRPPDATQAFVRAQRGAA